MGNKHMQIIQQAPDYLIIAFCKQLTPLAEARLKAY